MRVAGVLFALAIVAGSAIGTGVAQAPSPTGTLRGRVDIQRIASAREPRPGVADLGGGRPAEMRDFRPAVVYLESIAVTNGSTLAVAAAQARAGEPARGGTADAARPRIDQRNETFVPHVLAVAAGTVVDFPNNDRTYHNVFSLSKVNRFDLGRYGRGRSQSVRFDQPGVVRVFCDIHSHMSAFVLVFNHPFYSTTDAEGRYRIDNIPAGTYSVIAWHEGSARDTRTVTIPPAGTVDLELLVR